MNTMLEFSNASLSYPENRQVAAVQNINLRMQRGTFTAFIGPSGSGKTTTLKMLNRLLEPTSGSVFRAGKPLSEYSVRDLRLDTGYVLQNIALFPNMTAAENVSLSPQLCRWDKTRIQQGVTAILEAVGLPYREFGDRYPSQLSGGQQQRIALARALITQPSVLLMDEPFSALDPVTRYKLQKLTRKIHDEAGLTTVFVTHDMQEALRLADMIVVFDKGTIIQQCTPEDLMRSPANDVVRELLAVRGPNFLVHAETAIPAVTSL